MAGKVCEYFVQGRCKFGDRCRFVHPGVSNRDGGGGRREQGYRRQSDPRPDTGRAWDQRSGNRFQHLSDRDDWQGVGGGGGGWGGRGGGRGGSFNQRGNYSNYGSRQWNSDRQQGGRGGGGGGGGGGWNRSPFDTQRRGENWFGRRNEREGSDRGLFSSRGDHHADQFGSHGISRSLFGSQGGGNNRPVELPVDPSTPQEIVERIRHDMLEWREGSMWPFSCYTFKREGENVPGFKDVSPEEVRWEAYQAKASGNRQGYVQAVGALGEAQGKARQQYEHITEDEASKLVSQLGSSSLFGAGSNSSSTHLFSTTLFSTHSPPSAMTMFGGSKTADALFGAHRQEHMSSFGSGGGTTGLFGSNETGPSLFHGGTLLPHTSPTTLPSSSSTSTDTQPSYDEQYTTEELSAFKADKFVLGSIPERAPPPVLC